MKPQTVEQRLAALHADGFDQSFPVGRDDSGRFSKAIRVKCSKCEALCINGVACHETGCTNSKQERSEDDDLWDPSAPDDVKSDTSEE